MKKLKVLFWLIIAALLGTIVLQNKEFFLTRQSLSIDILAVRYQSPELHVAIFFVGTFLCGWLIAYFFGLAERFRDARTIRRLESSVSAQQNAIDSVRLEVQGLKNPLASGAEILPDSAGR